MPKRRPAPVNNEDDAIRSAALRFAAEVAGLVREGIAREVSSQVGRILDGISRTTAVAAATPAPAPRRVTNDRRIGKAPVPVACPVSGCTNVGIRAKRNFCAQHAATMSDAEKDRLREAQMTARSGATPQAAPAAPVAAAPPPPAAPAKKPAKKPPAKKKAPPAAAPQAQAPAAPAAAPAPAQAAPVEAPAAPAEAAAPKPGRTRGPKKA